MNTWWNRFWLLGLFYPLTIADFNFQDVLVQAHHLDLNDPVLELVTFDDSDPLEGSSSTPADIDPIMVEEEEESSDEFVDSSMEGDEEDFW